MNEDRAQCDDMTAIAEQSSRVAVVIPTYNRWTEARITLTCLTKSDYCNFEIILVEDGCIDGTTENCSSEFPQAHIIHGDGNLWWGGAINRGVEFALGHGVDLILWLNDDNRVEPQALKQMVEAYKLVGDRSIVCGRVKSTHTGEDEWVGEPPIWHPEFGKWAQPDLTAPIISLSYPPGGRGVLIPASCFREVGAIDERVFPQYWADHDFHYRAMNAGYRYYLTTMAVIWNVPYKEPPDAPAKFSFRWVVPFLFSRRSPMNMFTLRRLLKRHLQPNEYRAIYYSWFHRTLIWIISNWAASRPLLYRSLRFIGKNLI